MKLYPAWLKILKPALKRVDHPTKVKNDNYYIFSGNGFPSLLHKHLDSSIQDINAVGRFSALVVVLDADDAVADQRAEEVLQYYTDNCTALVPGVRLIVIVQNRCIETWLLGSKKMFKRNPQSADYREYIEFYNVRENDPELMSAMPPFEFESQFHEAYLIEMFLERNIRYSKRNPGIASSEDYLKTLISRADDGDLKSFKSMLNVVASL